MLNNQSELWSTAANNLDDDHANGGYSDSIMSLKKNRISLPTTEPLTLPLLNGHIDLIVHPQNGIIDKHAINNAASQWAAPQYSHELRSASPEMVTTSMVKSCEAYSKEFGSGFGKKRATFAVNGESVPRNSPTITKRRLIGSFEESLFRGIPLSNKKHKFTIDLSISKMIKKCHHPSKSHHNYSNYMDSTAKFIPTSTSTTTQQQQQQQQVIIKRLSLTTEASLTAECHDGHPLAPWSAKIDLDKPINIGRHTTNLQLVVRDEEGLAGKAFLLRMDLADMPVGHQTIIRQKHYYQSNLLTTPIQSANRLHHGIQVMVRRVMKEEAKGEEANLDSNGNVLDIGGRPRDRMQLFGSIRVVFTFNQAPTIGKDAIGLSGTLNERLSIVTEYPFALDPSQKYQPVFCTPQSSSVGDHESEDRTDDMRRLSYRPYGQIL